MEIKIHDSKKDPRLAKTINKIVNNDLSKIINKKNSNKINKIEIFVMYRISKKYKRHKDAVKDFDLWDEKTKTAKIWIAPSWLKNSENIRYGIRHELVHLKDVMENNLIALSKKPFKVKYRKNSKENYKIYDQHPDKDILDQKYELGWNHFVNYISLFYPWEKKAHKVSCEVQL